MMHWGNFGGAGYGAGFGWIFMVLFWALLILGSICLVKQLLGGSEETAGKESAENILKKRYAAGEITKDELNEKMFVIRGRS